ncbi:uncharacterized protein ACA1_218410 [Acanthamoeba castellanii str. Neff]|uniref:Uncharacterized protein n=1 Tax=Acanthamoeba castellanii (strain ATCC 30010 / Neff) TaxID=1257118 RepID=L8GQM6_ACACF|nr:uncharacterized protein ACA1_218410 [Acanthamoeba castellanii str. Neff]ELR15197.1 hypothetical protein ACA1_218410 [Acanthamoeba castellanii str. Neff]
MSTEQPKTAAAPAVDVSKLSEEEKAYYEKFGMLPKKSLASAMLDKRRGRAQFDSADWQLQKNSLPGQKKAPLPTNIAKAQKE